MMTKVFRSPLARALTALSLSMVLAGCNRQAEELSGGPALEQQVGMIEGDANEVLATVNDIPVTMGEIANEFDRLIAQSQQSLPDEQRVGVFAEWKPRLLDTLVTRVLLEEAAGKVTPEVAAEDVDSELDTISETLPTGMQLSDMLAMQGMVEDELRTQILLSLQVRRLVEQRGAGEGGPTDAQVQTFYDEHPQYFQQEEKVTARHILIAVEADASEEERDQSREEAVALRRQILDGADFSELAKEHSVCPSGAEGGLLPPFSKGAMVPEFETAAFAMTSGEVGEVVATDFGFHVIRVENHAAAGATPLADVSEDIREHLAQEQNRAVLDALIEELREAADIQYTDPALRPPSAALVP